MVSTPFHIGFEGPVPTAITKCNDPSILHGSNCVSFPNIGWLGAISWQSTMKVPGEALLILMVSPVGAGLGEPGEKRLLSTHHFSVVAANTVVKDILLPQPTYIPPGSQVWVHAISTGGPNPAGLEVQATLWV